MDIQFPTSLYEIVLPDLPEDNDNITYTISSTNPPRQSNALLEFPIEATRPIQPLINKILFDRRLVGEFVTALSFSNPDIPSNAKAKFEIGQILEFESEDLPVLENTLVPDVVELSQSTNILSEDLPITEEEREVIHTAASVQFNDLIDELNSLTQQISDNETLIEDNQKSINETRKAISALNTVFGNPTENGIIARLNDSLTQLESERDTLVSDTNILSQNAEETYDRLLSVREFVR